MKPEQLHGVRQGLIDMKRHLFENLITGGDNLPQQVQFYKAQVERYKSLCEEYLAKEPWMRACLEFRNPFTIRELP